MNLVDPEAREGRDRREDGVRGAGRESRGTHAGGNIERETEDDVAAVGVGLMHLHRENVVPIDQTAGGNIDGAFVDGVAHRAIGEGGVAHRASGQAETVNLRAIQVEDRAIIDDGLELQPGAVRIAGEGEVGAKIISRSAQGKRGALGSG